MKIKQYIHLYNDENRFCWSLVDDNNKFIDSFDYNTKTNKIRFYGDYKEYAIDNVPDYKKKTWKIEFHDIIFIVNNL